MNTTQTMTRKELLRLSAEINNKGFDTVSGSGVDSGSREYDDNDHDHEHDEFDDFTLHNLRDLGPIKKLGGLSALSESSGSSASTVVHNPEFHNNNEIENNIDVIGLQNIVTIDEDIIRKREITLNDNNDKIDDPIELIERPSSPPREIDPTKLYALYDFSGPDPSHLSLNRDDAVHLLNDTDVYWWLVRKDNNGIVGFAPAEILETYGERLARLNCWKNEILERGNINELENDELELFNKFVNENDSVEVERKGSFKRPFLTKKSVSFAEEDVDNDIMNISHSENENENENDGNTHINLNSDEDCDDFSILRNYENFASDEEQEINHSIDNENNDDNDDNSNYDNKTISKNKSIPLSVPKRRNMFIKDLDTYDGSTIGSGSVDNNSMISEHNNQNTTLNSSNDSLKNENISKSESDKSIPILTPATSTSTIPQRLESLQMLDDLLDMYPEFITLDEGFVPEQEEQVISTDSNINTNTTNTTTSSPLSLHPRTASIFDPVMSHVQQLDSLINELVE